MNVRELVFRSLERMEKEKKYSSLELDSVIEKADLHNEDKSFFTNILYGVTERRITLDYIISLYSSKPIGRLDLSTLIILRMGVYQLLFLDRVPKSAAVNESVKLALRYSSRSVSFVNAILRKASLLSEIPLPDKNSSPLLYLSVKYSLPRQICELWQKDYSEYGEELFSFVNGAPYITLRVNTLKSSTEAVCKKHPDLFQKCENAPYGLRLTSRVPISELELEKGEYFVQDEASQIAAEALKALPGETIVDVCACPGGKSFGAAMYMENRGQIYAFDIHKSKLPLIAQGAERLGIGIIKAYEHDSQNAADNLIGMADRVICDVPCSGLGVLSKKSDLRYKDLSDLSSLCELQYKILCQSARYLKPGGILVYSTCTLNKAENEDIVNRFLSCNPDFSLAPFSAGKIISNGMLTLFPHIHNTDGFFIAKTVKHS